MARADAFTLQFLEPNSLLLHKIATSKRASEEHDYREVLS